jgi:hypothetical protein
VQHGLDALRAGLRESFLLGCIHRGVEERAGHAVIFGVLGM